MRLQSFVLTQQGGSYCLVISVFGVLICNIKIFSLKKDRGDEGDVDLEERVVKGKRSCILILKENSMHMSFEALTFLHYHCIYYFGMCSTVLL